MRVIAGLAKGRRLQPVPGDTTRPITDRAKEALFSILQPELAGARVLDLFAGTGGVGIEALSRGAAACDFVERAPKAIEAIRANLSLTGLAEFGRIVRGDVQAYLASTRAEPYHLIYVAPPQYQGLWRKTLEAIDTHPDRLAEDGIVVVQIHPVESAAIALEHLVEYDRRKYGSVLLVFYERRVPDGEDVHAAEDAAGADAPSGASPAPDPAR